MTFTDAPIPTNPAAKFAAWQKSIDERLNRLEYKKGVTYVLAITDTTDSSGYIIFEHGGMTTPTAIIIQPNGPTGGGTIFAQAMVDTITETTARLRALNNVGAALNGATINFFALVIY